MARCPHCDWELRESDRFCANDGRALVRANTTPHEVKQYITDKDVFEGVINVENVGVNPLEMALRVGTEAIGLEAASTLLRPGMIHRFHFTVDLTHSNSVREAIEIISNESDPQITRIPIEVSRPPQLQARLEPESLYYGESGECQLVVTHTGGGHGTIRRISCPDGWAEQPTVTGEETLVGGDHAAYPLKVIINGLNEGEYTRTVDVDLEGLGRHSFEVPFRLTRRPEVNGKSVNLGKVLPDRVRTAFTEIANDSGLPIMVTSIRFTGGNWLVPAPGTRFPIRVEPGEKIPVKVVGNTHGLKPGKQRGNLVFHWNRDQERSVPVQLEVLRPEVYAGYAGVDFGTTNSCVYVSKPGDNVKYEPDPVPLAWTNEGTPVFVIPTAIYFPNPANLDQYEVGIEALTKAMRPDTAANTVLRIKQRLGQEEPLYIHDQPLSPVAAAAKILRYLLDQAEDHIGMLINQAVVTVPANYSNRQMKAMLEACRLAGLVNADVEDGSTEALTRAREQDVLDILDEPLAAALEYANTGGGKSLGNQPFVVFDFGGGTVDVSLVQAGRAPDGTIANLQVLAVEGRSIGGEEITDLLEQELGRRVRAQKNWTEQDLPYEIDPDEWELCHPARQQQILYNRVVLREHAEQMKRQFAARRVVQRDLSVLAGHPSQQTFVTVEMNRQEFHDLIREKVEATVALISEVLDFAKVRPSEVSRVVMVGGSSQLLLVQESIAKLGIAMDTGFEPKQCVAAGAYRLGSQRAGMGDSTRTLGLFNRTSARYGIMVGREGTGGREFAEIVPKGAELPMKECRFYPDDLQPGHRPLKVSRSQFEVQVVMNRSRRDDADVADLQSLGRIKVKVPGASPVEPVFVRVQMQIDKFKVLKVEIYAGEHRLEQEINDV